MDHACTVQVFFLELYPTASFYLQSYSKVGPDGTRYLLGDIFGNLLLLAIEGENGR